MADIQKHKGSHRQRERDTKTHGIKTKREKSKYKPIKGFEDTYANHKSKATTESLHIREIHKRKCPPQHKGYRPPQDIYQTRNRLSLSLLFNLLSIFALSFTKTFSFNSFFYFLFIYSLSLSRLEFSASLSSFVSLHIIFFLIPYSSQFLDLLWFTISLLFMSHPFIFVFSILASYSHFPSLRSPSPSMFHKCILSLLVHLIFKPKLFMALPVCQPWVSAKRLTALQNFQALRRILNIC